MYVSSVLQIVCLRFVICVNSYVTCLIEMENASKRELLVTVNKQKDQLARYEGRLRGKVVSENCLVCFRSVT